MQMGSGQLGFVTVGIAGTPTGRASLRAYHAPRQAISYQRPSPYEPTANDGPDALYEFFDLRGIGAETVDQFGLYVTERGFRMDDQWAPKPCIVFPYIFGGTVVNRKYRALTEKSLMMQEKEPYPTLWNIDAVTSDDALIWVEGEPDVMALHEAGYRQIVTLKDGAPDKLRAEDDPARETDKRFAALSTHADKLAGIKKIILAGDDDEPGRILREELARRLGRHRCWIAEWYPGCKDAGDTLRAYGPAAVQHCVEAARPWPVEGVQEVTADALDAHLSAPPPLVLTTGIPSVNSVLRVPGEGRVIVVTGYPNNGKSKWTMNVMVNMMRLHQRRWLVFSPEMQPTMEFAVECAQVLTGKPARSVKTRPDLKSMTHDDRRGAGEWLRGRLSFLATDAEDRPPSLDCDS